MGLMDKLGGNLAQGLMGNLTEVSPEKLTGEYGCYLMDGESIQSGYILVRDAVLFTNKRIIYVDKQGATGQKTRINTIYLDSIINVSMCLFHMSDCTIPLRMTAPFEISNLKK